MKTLSLRVSLVLAALLFSISANAQIFGGGQVEQFMKRKREAEAEAAFKANMMLVTAGDFTSPTGTVIGKIASNGDVFNKAGQRLGHVSSDGKVTDFNGGGKYVAAVCYYFFFKTIR